MKFKRDPAEIDQTNPTPLLKRRIRLSNMVVLLGMFPAIGTGIAIFGSFHWLADLFTHFVVQYAVSLTVASLVLALSRRWLSAAIFALLVLWNTAEVVPLWFGHETIAATPVLRLFIANVNTQTGNASMLQDAIAEAEPDVVLLEEVSDAWMTRLASLDEQYPHNVTFPRPDNFGIALYSKHPLENVKIDFLGEAAVPTIVATLRVDDRFVQFVGTHPLPPVGERGSRLRNEQLRLVGEYVASLDGPAILAGDFNTTPWTSHFKNLLKQTGMSNSAAGYGLQATWPADNVLLRIPLDHCLISPDLVVVNRAVGPDIESDHFPIVIDLALRNNSPS